MAVGIIAIFIPFVFFIVSGVVLNTYIKTRHTERMEIIQKGISGDDLQYFLGQYNKKTTSSLRMAKWGIILISIGLAVIIGSMFSPGIREEVITGLIFLFPGLGLLFYYRLFSKAQENGQVEETSL